MSEPFDGSPEQPIIRDKRRIDPVTGEVRGRSQGETPGTGHESESAPQSGTASSASAAEVSSTDPFVGLEAQFDGVPGLDELAASEAEAANGAAAIQAAQAEAAERTEDLKRLQAEYSNYRKRVERDRELSADLALVRALTELLPVLDDIGRARDHGDVTGGFKSVVDALEAATTRLGLEQFGQPGDPFDPLLHEALMHTHSDDLGPDVTGPICETIVMPGYRIGERILRPARVAVVEP